MTGRLTKRQVIAILKSKRSPKALASKYGVHVSHISNIQRGYTWRSIAPEIQRVKKKSGAKRMFSEKQAIAILNDTRGPSPIARDWRVSRTCIAQIKLGIRYGDVAPELPRRPRKPT